jgi:hypothetical protein
MLLFLLNPPPTVAEMVVSSEDTVESLEVAAVERWGCCLRQEVEGGWTRVVELWNRMGNILILTLDFILATCHTSMKWKGINGDLVNGAKMHSCHTSMKWKGINGDLVNWAKMHSNIRWKYVPLIMSGSVSRGCNYYRRLLSCI